MDLVERLVALIVEGATEGDYSKIDEARTAVTELVEWQPIETAPKDGSNVLLLTERGNVFAPCVYQEAGVISEDGFWLVWRSHDFDEVANPTHWRPLPAPPTQGGSQ